MARALLTHESRRQRMVSEQLVRRDIIDPHVLAAFGVVAREQFVPGELGPQAYDDAPLPIGSGQRSEEHTSELQSLAYLLCRLPLEKNESLTSMAVPGFHFCPYSVLQTPSGLP